MFQSCDLEFIFHLLEHEKKFYQSKRTNTQTLLRLKQNIEQICDRQPCHEKVQITARV